MCIIKAGFLSLNDDWAECKEKVPHMSDSNQNVETTFNSKLRFTELKRFIHLEGAEKSVKSKLWAILKFQDITSHYWFLIRLVNTFIVDSEQH